jgi:type IV pilus assembly protein PilF
MFLLNGCVSNATGPEEREPDEEAAALQYYSLGARYFRNGQYDIARDRLEYALEFDPKYAVAHSVLAMTYQALDNQRLATEHFDLAVRYGPKDIGVRNTYAVFLCQHRKFDEAREQFDRAINLPENDEPEIMLTNAGVCVGNKPDNVAAEEYFRRALTAKPSYGEALLQMAVLKRKTDENLAARAFLQRYLSANTANSSILYFGVKLEEDLGNMRAATDYSNQLLRDYPESAEARRLLQAN